MHTDGAALFLFAHQDDEFGVLQHIADYRRDGVPVACAYLTDGQARRARAARRNAESRAVLGRLGVAPRAIVFAGEALGIADASLPLQLAAAHAWIARWLDAHGPVAALHIPAWEGGHQDHDALHAVAVALAQQRGLLERTWQFSLYRAAGLSVPLARVLAPLAANGRVLARHIPWHDRMRNLHCCLSYPSQATTWLLLFPPVLWHYLVYGVEALQPVAPARTLERPHEGLLYYEKRRFFTWPKMQLALDAWRAGCSSDQPPGS
jgi:LmbE family N-acetylglucosaminyl deacetylase